MTVKASELLSIAEKVLRELGIYDYKNVELTLTYKEGGDWKVSFTFTRGSEWAKRSACFAVDKETGEILLSAIDKVWKTGK